MDDEISIQQSRKRAVLRGLVTKSCNALLGMLNECDPSLDIISAHFQVLERRFGELDVLNNEINGCLLDKGDQASSDLLLKEMISVDEYSLKFFTVKAKVENLLNHPDLESASSSHSKGTMKENSYKIRLPKIDLIKFEGDVGSWLAFWATFSIVHDDEELSNVTKFQYLLQATTPGSRARALLDSFPPSASNYPKAVAALKSRFGREDLLIEHYIREMLRLVLRKRDLSVSSLYDSLKAQLSALETLDVMSDNYAAILFPLLESCIPPDVLKVWQRTFTNHTASFKVQMDSLMTFLENEVRGEERVLLAVSDHEGSTVPPRDFSLASAAALANLSLSDKKLCAFCNGSHETVDCFKAHNMTLKERHKVLSSSKRCLACTKANHNTNKCRARCIVCKGCHVPIMCPNIGGRANADKDPNSNASEVDLLSVNHSLTASSNQDVLLQTFVALARNDKDTREIRILIDSGSQRSYICKRLATELAYKPIGLENTVHSLFGGGTTGVVKHNIYRARLLSLSGDFACRFSVMDQDRIASAIPTATLDAELKDELLKLRIQLCKDSNGPIDVLIGADVAGKMWTGKKVVLSSGLVVMQTHFGWTIMGAPKVTNVSRTLESTACSNLATTYTMMSVTQSDITDLWKLEAIGITDPAVKKTKEERQLATLEHFKSTVEFTGGRYQVRLPWKEEAVDLPSNRGISEGRLMRNSAKLKQGGLFSNYDSIFQEWQRSNIIESAVDDDRGHYLPHRPVIKESSSTTRVRPVFDASAKLHGYASLNDCLEEGPNLIELLPAVLMRFREKKVGVSADIEKAFLQIGIHPEDRDFLKFLWWNPENEQMVVFRHARVVFGVTSSPFLLGAVLDFHLNSIPNTDPLSKQYLDLLRKGFYVDNLATSLDSVDDVTSFQEIATGVLARGGFNLRAWEFSGQLTTLGDTGLLGVKWNKVNDTISINLDWWEQASKMDKPTKRSVLSIGQRLFDPIGFSVPASLYLKLLVQELWVKKVGWDDLLEAEDKKVFTSWLQDAHQLKEVKLSRCLGSSKNLTLHVFCDASSKAYAAAVFVRSEEDGVVRVELIQAKARVAPLNTLSIPRLELLAATIGARLLQSVQEALGWFEVPTILWTDSSTVLAWIQRQEEWTVFVRNRIREIRALTRGSVWRHLPGEHNPADLPSRGCTVSQLLEGHWWLGPDWLRASEEQWPLSHCSYEEMKIQNEKLKRHIVMLNYTPDFQWLYSYFSKYEKIVRMVAWIKRFSSNCRTKRRFRVKGPLSLGEVESAELSVVRLVQVECLILPSDRKLSELQPFVDDKGIVRLKTKIAERIDDVASFKAPAVLPSEHPVVERLVYDQHCRSSHVGTQTLLGILREKFWILKGRMTLRRVINKCVTCRRFSSKSFDTISPPLPESRVRDSSVFEVTGVDYAGPLYLRDGAKVWISLFTCANFRAVHLELVPSLSSETFILALRRFIARRGRPKIIYSDNGTNFHGAENAFATMDWSQISTYCTVERIQWRFNPPTAAWWGGFWERLVGLVKQLLRKTLGRAALDLDELSTVLCDCEALINSRPLTHLSENGTDPVSLTPAMFLQDLQVVLVPECDVFESESLEKRLRYRQSLRDQLRLRFRSEYLGQLTWSRRKSTQEPSIGEVVLIGSDNVKRLDWPLAIVEQLVVGRDGRTRVLHLRTSSGSITRTIQRVYPLEITVAEPEVEDPEEVQDEPNEGNLPNTDPLSDDSGPSATSGEILEQKEDSSEQKKTRGGRLIVPPKKLDL